MQIRDEPSKPKLLIATGNRGKIAELKDMLVGADFDLIGLNDFDHIVEVEETGTTFDANARLKAAGYARQTGLAALADDSGLEVAALGGRPGVLSARYGGEDTAFERKMELLLDEIAMTGSDDRRARFMCSIAVADPDGNIIHSATGVCDGIIAPRPRGSGGFGYDPLFIPDGFEKTFGELPDEIKRQISHRARAFSQIIPFLRHYMAV